MNELTIQVVFQDDEANGEICDNCHCEIKGTKYVMMVQVGGPEEATPAATYCILCKLEWDSK